MLLLSLLSQARSEEVTVRLSASPYFGAGYVEVWREGRWGAVCPQPGAWTKATANLVCRHLGFSDSTLHQQGERSYAPQPRGVFRVTDSLACPPGAERLEQCQLGRASGCSPAEALALICRPEAKSGCGPGSTAMLGHCYRIFQQRKTFHEAQAECKRISANLVEILSQKENLLLSSLVQKSPEHRDTTSYWTGGVISEVANAKFTFWHGSQNKIVFDNQIDKNKAKEKTQGISFQPKKDEKYPGWRTEDMDQTRLPFICQSVPENIGCLKADDPLGSNYVGPATRDRDGNLCAAWNSEQNYRWADNYCRNPDNNDRPYCLLPSGEPSNCDIPLCSLLPSPSSLECRGKAELSVNTCHKEEYHCRNGKCISTDYVCDGARDCDEDEEDDEEGCRVLSSLFDVMENYKLEGNLKAATSESVRASLEECARLCLYQKLNGTGCCDSFSHRAGKDGKDDRCTLGSVYVTNSLNSSIDSLVEKKAWNYYKLNDTANTNTQCGLNFNWKRELEGAGRKHVVAVRLNNKERGSKGNLLEVKLVGQDWGGVCHEGFGPTEASLVCRQVGFQLGSRRVVAVPGRAVVSGLQCGGQERSLAECSLSASAGCPSGQVVTVDCLKSRCEETEFQCGSGECIPTAGLCDSVAQCKDGSDESEDHCGARTNVRLTQPGGHKGLLELRHRGVWGSVCEFNFGRGEADVFCHMLGFDRAANWSSGELDVFRSGSWPVWISFGRPNSCSGAEETLEECHDKSHWKDDGSCRHNEDIFLECKVRPLVLGTWAVKLSICPERRPGAAEEGCREDGPAGVSVRAVAETARGERSEPEGDGRAECGARPAALAGQYQTAGPQQVLPPLRGHHHLALPPPHGRPLSLVPQGQHRALLRQGGRQRPRDQGRGGGGVCHRES